MDKYIPENNSEIGSTSCGLVYLGNGLYGEHVEVDEVANVNEAFDALSDSVSKALDNLRINHMNNEWPEIKRPNPMPGE